MREASVYVVWNNTCKFPADKFILSYAVQSVSYMISDAVNEGNIQPPTINIWRQLLNRL